MSRAPDMPKGVSEAFNALPPDVRARLMEVRALIFALAAELEVGPLRETLKWGQPAYLSEATRAGTTIRLGASGGRAAAFVHCTTRLVDGFRADFGDRMAFEGNRAVLLDDAPDDALAICLSRALTYHRARRKERAA